MAQLSRNSFDLLVVGAGLAGCEAAFAAARRGLRVELWDIKPERFSPAHELPGPAELVCSNSLGSENETTASGLLKAEMTLLDSVVVRAARECRVPAGQSLAVDRRAMTDRVAQVLDAAGIVRVCREADEIPDGPCVVATGPLTTDALAGAIARAVGTQSLFYFDATSPIVDGETIDRQRVYAASRWGKGDPDFLNCPMTEEEYRAFHQALMEAEKVAPHDFEDNRLFEACMPVEDIAARGEMTLAFGPMRPIGLYDACPGGKPFAVVQLRREDPEGRMYSLVGFQSRMRHGDQRRVFRMIPGLEKVDFLRLGVIHRNTYVDGPRALDETLRLRARTNARFAGQIAGVEGYLESAACGLLVGLFAAAEIRGNPISLPSETTLMGALVRHVSSSPAKPFLPMNANMGLLPSVPGRRDKAARKELKAKRAVADMTAWRDSHLK